jgi:[ribosomal protein S5]-alanine N-acetyltransferase
VPLAVEADAVGGGEIICSLDKHLRGGGLATEATQAVLDYALSSLGLPEVLAEADEGNREAAAVIRRLA